MFFTLTTLNNTVRIICKLTRIKKHCSNLFTLTRIKNTVRIFFTLTRIKKHCSNPFRIDKNKKTLFKSYSHWQEEKNTVRIVFTLTRITKHCSNIFLHWLPHRTVFHFFERYYDAKEVTHQRFSWNWENISKSGSKVRPKIAKNWIFNEKVHRISKTSQNRFSLFRKILRC